jgi:hypothetical protein
MPDTLTITLPPETAAQVKREAKARGISAEAVAAEMIEAMAAGDVLDWEEDLRRLEESGENLPAGQVFAEIEARLAERARPAK